MGGVADSCPLCSSLSLNGSRFGLLACEQCGLIVDRSAWTPLVNERLNDANFGEGYRRTQSGWVRAFEALSNRRRMRFLRKHLLPNQRRLLEVGVGSGSFLARASALGFSAEGCDLSPTICRRAEVEAGAVMHCGSLDSMPSGPIFDVIVMHHVLEHVANPMAILEDARDRLKAGGILQIAVPNSAAWEARLPGWNSYEPYHLLYFTSATLRLAVEQAGFQVAAIGTHESFSGWILAVLRTATGLSAHERTPGSLKRAPRPPVAEHGYRLLLVLSGLITFPLRRLQEWLGYGDELILVARQPLGKEARQIQTVAGPGVARRMRDFHQEVIERHAARR